MKFFEIMGILDRKLCDRICCFERILVFLTWKDTFFFSNETRFFCNNESSCVTANFWWSSQPDHVENPMGRFSMTLLNVNHGFSSGNGFFIDIYVRYIFLLQFNCFLCQKTVGTLHYKPLQSAEFANFSLSH